MKNNMETSKKIALFAAICFAAVLIYSMVLFGYDMYIGNSSDPTMLVALITVSGAAFGTTCAFYYNKAKGENLFKLKREFLQDKYTILQEFHLLNDEYVESEIMNEVEEIESDFDEEEDIVNQEITYNE